MKPRNLYRIGIGALLLASGAAALLVAGGDGIAATLFLCAGLALLVTGIVRHRRYGDDPESDERTRKIGANGLAYAWLTGLFFLTALFWLDDTGALVLGTRNALAASVIVLALSAVAWQAWLFRRGDAGQ